MIATRLRFLAVKGYDILDFKEYLSKGRIEVHLERTEGEGWRCSRCGTELGAERGHYRVKMEGMPITGYRTYYYLWRYKGHCGKCKKARTEGSEFISQETPHLTQDYSWWIGRLCEIGAVSRVAELLGLNEVTTWRIDFARMKRMLAFYKIPEVKRISVDEVYSRKKPKFKGESRDERFFTIVSDLDTRRVIWVSPGRRKESLDQFFILIGSEACKKIEVVATDLHDAYAVSVKEYCPNATVVWDRFHIMQIFEQAVNETRKDLHAEQARGSEMHRLTRGGFRFMFLKKASRRTEEETKHIDDVLKENEQFAKLELIKERMLTIFYERDEEAAKKVFEEIGRWIWQCYFKPLQKWYNNFEKGWDTFKNYFTYRITSSLSEGINNVIKVLKRRGYGYRNMLYFRLKIMQVCGYLNSKYVSQSFQPLALI